MMAVSVDTLILPSKPWTTMVLTAGYTKRLTVGREIALSNGSSSCQLIAWQTVRVCEAM